MRSPATMTLVIGAVLLTLAVLLYHWQETSASEEFVEGTRFRIWAVLLCVQSALWAILAPPTWKSLRSLYSDFGADRRMLVGIAIPVTAIVALVVGFELLSSSAVPDYPLADHPTKLRILTGVGFLVALSALAGMWLVEAAIERRRPNRRMRALVEYLRLRDDLRRFLDTAAAIIGAATLSTGALRGAVVAEVPGAEFPAEYVLYYGAFFSVVVALAYMPALLACRNVGRQLADTLLPLPDAEPGSWADWYANRRALEALMELDAATSKGMRAGLAVAAPFIGSALGLLLGTGA
jgi:hypothetical protein